MPTSIFPGQQSHSMNPKPVMQPAPQQSPQEIPQPVHDTNEAYISPEPSRPAMQGVTMQPYPQQLSYQNEAVPYPLRQIQQQTNGQVYQTAPAAHETYCFDPEDENDRELLKEDPYAEYPDFPAEYRMKDEAQVEMIYC